MSESLRTHLISNGGINNVCSSLCQRIKDFIKKITVEPALLLFFFCYGSESALIINLWIDKICLFHFNYTEEICLEIQSGKYPEEQDNVQKIASNYIIYARILQYIPSVFIILLLGTWSDRRGRRLPIIVPILGYILTSLNLTAVSYWWTLSPVYLFISYLPLAFTGGVMGLYAAVYPYLTAVTSQESRTPRISFQAFVIVHSASFGKAAAKSVYESFGYVAVFGGQALLLGCSILYVMLVLKERPEGDVPAELHRTDEGVQHIFSPSHLKETLMVGLKERTAGKRGEIQSHIKIIMMIVFVTDSLSYLFFYTSKNFQPDSSVSSMYWIGGTPLAYIAMVTVLPYMSSRWKVDDYILGLMIGIAMVLINFIKGIAPPVWFMYVASVKGKSLNPFSVASRSAVSKLVEKNEAGAVFAVIGATEAVVPIVSAVVYTQLYNATLGTFPGAIFILSTGLCFIICCIYVWMIHRQYQQPIRDPDQGNSSLRFVY